MTFKIACHFGILLAITTIAVLAHRTSTACANTVSYEFTGTMAFGGPGPIAVGEPFSGSFTLDLSTVGQPNPFSSTATDYDQVLPPASFSFTVAGLTVTATDAAIATIDHQSLVDNFSLFVESQSLVGPGWSFTPAGGRPTSLTINFDPASGTLPDLANLPNLGLLAPLPSGPQVQSIDLAAGTYLYPGGSFVLAHSSELHFTIDSLILVSEPSHPVLAAPVFGLFVWWKRRSVKKHPC